jgi:hypothetical protein
MDYLHKSQQEWDSSRLQELICLWEVSPFKHITICLDIAKIHGKNKDLVLEAAADKEV